MAQVIQVTVAAMGVENTKFLQRFGDINHFLLVFCKSIGGTIDMSEVAADISGSSDVTSDTFDNTSYKGIAISDFLNREFIVIQTGKPLLKSGHK